SCEELQSRQDAAGETDGLRQACLLAAAFRPDEKTCQLRAYLRQRANVVRRVVPGGAPVRVEASLRGLAVLPGAGRQGGRTDRPPIRADEERPGPAAAEAEGASEAPGQFAPVRRPDGVVLRGRAGLDGDRGDQRADGADLDQRDRPRAVAVCNGEEVL